MKRLAILVLLTAGISSGCSSEVEVSQSQRVLLFIRDGSADLEYMLKSEAAVMKDALEQSGLIVDVATTTGEGASAGEIRLEPVLKVADVLVKDYAGIIIPCMAVDDQPGSAVDPDAVDLVREAVSSGIPVAAQLGAVRILARAGVLQGRNYASYVEWDVNDFPSFEGSTHSGEGVVKDGLIITSGICPFMAREKGIEDGTEELVQALVDSMKASRI